SDHQHGVGERDAAVAPDAAIAGASSVSPIARVRGCVGKRGLMPDGLRIHLEVCEGLQIGLLRSAMGGNPQKERSSREQEEKSREDASGRKSGNPGASDAGMTNSSRAYRKVEMQHADSI